MRIVIFYLVLLLFASCAFIDHKSTEHYSSTSNQLPSKNTSFAIMISGGDDKIVGNIKNGFGTRTANIEIPTTKNLLIQNALTQEFEKLGFKIAQDSSNLVLARINQIETEFSQEGGAAGYYSICDLQLYFKNNSGMYERNVIENDKVMSFWAITASDGVKSLYTAINKCSNTAVNEIEKRIQK